MARYAVVSFDTDNAVSVVPSCWLTDSGKKCFWPPWREYAKVVRAIKDRTAPQESWEQHSGRVLAKCDDYAEARRLSKKAENSSDLQSEGERGRGHRTRIRRRLSDSSDSSESSSSTVVITKKKRLSSPPDLDDVPPLMRQNATLERPSPAFSNITTPSRPLHACSETPEKSKETRQTLRAVARCEASIDELHEKVNEILHMLRGMKKFQEKPSTMEDFAEIHSLIPVRSLEELKKLNEKLESDSSFEQLLYRRLVKFGGTCIKMAVKYIIDACTTNELQMKLNWEGRIGWKTKANESKTGFKSTKLCSVMTRVLLDNNQFSTTEEEIARTTMKYLRNAADRCGGRKRRSDGKTQNAEGSV